MSDHVDNPSESDGTPSQIRSKRDLPVMATYMWIAINGLGFFILLYEHSSTKLRWIGVFLFAISAVGMFLRWGLAVPCTFAGILLSGMFLPTGVDTTHIVQLVLGAIIGFAIGATADMARRNKTR